MFAKRHRQRLSNSTTLKFIRISYLENLFESMLSPYPRSNLLRNMAKFCYFKITQHPVSSLFRFYSFVDSQHSMGSEVALRAGTRSPPFLCFYVFFVEALSKVLQGGMPRDQLLVSLVAFVQRLTRRCVLHFLHDLVRNPVTPRSSIFLQKEKRLRAITSGVSSLSIEYMSFLDISS